MSYSINKVTLIGNVGQEPEIRMANNGTEIANLSIATTEKWKDRNTGEAQSKTEWHRVVMIGPLAGICKQYVRKGSKIYVEGKLQTRKWQDQSGQDRYTTEVLLSGPGSDMVLLDRPGESAGGGVSDFSSSVNQDLTGNKASYQGGSSNNSSSMMDDEIPF